MPTRTALVMCGGKSKGLGYVCKSLIMYNGKFILSHVLSALRDAGVTRAILKANPSNAEHVEFIARKYFPDYHVASSYPQRFRDAVKELKEYFEEPFYLVAGNQPMRPDHLLRLQKLKDKDCSWAVSLYDSEVNGTKVIEGKNGRLELAENGQGLNLQHPFILTPEITRYQEQEKFSKTLEQTIANQLHHKRVKGVIAEMPPEFDTWEMFENTKKYVDKIA